MSKLVISTGEFHNGFSRIQREDGMWNFMDEEGKILSSEWFKLVHPFTNGFARVQREDNMWNYIDKKGEILSPNIWFHLNYGFNNGFGIIMNFEGKCGLIDTNGKLATDIKFDNICYCNGLYVGTIDDIKYAIDLKLKEHRLLL